MSSVITKVKVALGLMKFEDAVLVDGTKVSAEVFEPGQLLSVVAEDGSVSAAPEGRHETADAFITTDANGIIVSVEPKPAVEEVAAQEEVAMEEEIEVEVPEAIAEAPVAEEVIQSVVDALTPALEAIAAEVEMLKKKMEEMVPSVDEVKEEMNKFKKAPGASKIATGPSSLHNFAKENVEDLGSKLTRLKAMTAGMNVKF